MSDVVNLNRFKKAKVKSDKAEQAAENRVKFGRTKAQKAKDQAETARAKRELDRHKIDYKSND